MSEKDSKILGSVIPNLDPIKIGLPDFSSIIDPVRELTKGIAEMQKSIVSNPAVKQLSETLASIHKSCVFDVAKKIQNIKFDFIQPLESILKNESVKSFFRGVKYLSSIEKSGWPLYHLTFQRVDDVMSLEKEDFFPFLLSFYENQYKSSLAKSWENAPIINEMRKPILKEALSLFENHFYYGTCSVLMCQLYGIAEDIDCYSRAKFLVISEEDIKEIDELYGITDSKKFPKEKRRLFQKIMHVQECIALWDRSLQYINDFVLKNPQKPIEELTVPHRNKICHGEQLNFGTQEHALKAIFIIDSLINFSNEIYSSTQDV